tara:strand:- start:940 stop:1380 length:441 start_codon:yes stop_codon:yes gene_type:complete
MIQVSVDCDPNLDSPKENIVKEISSSVFKKYNISEAEISLIFGSDKLLSSLKKQFFHKDQWTDVIAFRLNEYKEKSVEGEIYISLPRAKENAESFGEPFEKEVARLIIHGNLHLLGFEDETEEEKTEMTKLENDFLSQINWQTLFE